MERKEAIEVIKKNWPDSSFTMLREALVTLIPELEESKDERIRKALINGFKDYNGWDEEWFDGMTVREAIAWLEKQGEQNPNPCDGCINRKGCINCENGELREAEQNPAWSEEDINMFGSILSTLGICANNPQIPADVRSIHEKEELWFNELYHRAQPKQEWSEEDEGFLCKCLGALGNPNYCYEDGELECMRNWLKSIRPQSQWKPSKEQMEAIKDAIKFLGCTKKVREDLKSLYKQMKKLTE